eukprot:s4831_g1.t2
MMEKLLQRPQNPDSRGYHGKLTPLCEAAFAGHIEAVQLLLEASADKEKRDGRGRTPLQWAAEAGQREMVKLLLQAGADKDKSPGLPVPGTGTPLQVVCSTGDVEIARLLIEAGADKEKVSRPAPNTPLQIACSKGYEDLVKLLLEARADADRALPLMDGGTLLDSQGTPLQTACREGHVAIVRMLLEAGASRNKVSRSCLEKPLQLAFASRHLDIARLVDRFIRAMYFPPLTPAKFRSADGELHAVVSLAAFEALRRGEAPAPPPNNATSKAEGTRRPSREPVAP